MFKKKEQKTVLLVWKCKMQNSKLNTFCLIFTRFQFLRDVNNSDQNRFNMSLPVWIKSELFSNFLWSTTCCVDYINQSTNFRLLTFLLKIFYLFLLNFHFQSSDTHFVIPINIGRTYKFLFREYFSNRMKFPNTF